MTPVVHRARSTVLGMLLVGLVATPALGEERFALLIGANLGWSKDRPLLHAEAEVERVRDVLVALGGFPADRVELLQEPDAATVRARLRHLARTLRALGGTSVVLVHYVGHADERHLHLRGAPLSREELQETLRALPATHRLGVIDAGGSSAVLTVRSDLPAPGFEAELSVEGSRFTSRWLEGLRGPADLDHDGVVTLSEAHGYAAGWRPASESVPLTWPARAPALPSPSERDGGPEAEEDRERGRQEALRLLAEGEVDAALSLLEGLLAAKPDDASALRMRARAWVRLSEAHAREGATRRERQALRAALEADPSLAEDPDFAPQHQRLQELEAAEQRDEEIRGAAERESQDNPRRGHRWGVGLDAVGTRGALALVGTVIVQERWFLHLSVEPFGPGTDLGFRWVPLGWRWSPTFGMGGHVPFSQLGLGSRTEPVPDEDGWVDVKDPALIQRELRRGYLHLDVGVQYFTSWKPALACELGLGLRLFHRPSIRSVGILPALDLGCGLYF